ncbi:MAG: indolepyruvate ferredoxin oxidoreductase subunit alpha [Candidatus Aminicenantia bacterium]
MKVLLSGNEGVARGAWEAGVRVATAYPGTPSTEILEALSEYEEVEAVWSINEKVALEVALGASFAGARTITSMKHVGLNVAADPLFSAGYIGAYGGLVIISCDDPGMHSSQNEQDNRYYSKMVKIPLLEPSDSNEAKELTKLAFEISERFDTPVLLRLTTRISHSKSIVELGERVEVEEKNYQKQFDKRVLLPSVARKRHVEVEKRLVDLKEFSENFSFNRIEIGDKKIGIITSGVAYQYAKEVFEGASFLKLTMSFPFPEKLVRRFAEIVEKIIVVEELEPFIEENVRALEIKVTGKEKVPNIGELNPQILRDAFQIPYKRKTFILPSIPQRPPALCPGCPHTPVYYVLKMLNPIVTGDIGCYTLGALPPLSTTDSCVDMGASVGNAFGIELAYRRREDKPKIVAVIGDSTFFHSGITPLIDMVYNKGTGTVLILDNSTTAMTGHQDHPGTGRTAKGEEGVKISIESLVKGIGIKNLFVVDPYDVKNLKEVINREIHRKEPSVIITNRPCVLHKNFKGIQFSPVRVNSDLCTSCKLCLRLGCPSISMKDNKALIDELTCTGCGVCMELCPPKAITWVDPSAPSAKNPFLKKGGGLK